MSIKNEKGSIFLEAISSIILLFIFLVGYTTFHLRFQKKAHAILEHRNRSIQEIRTKKAKLFSFDFSNFSFDGGNYKPAGK